MSANTEDQKNISLYKGDVLYKEGDKTDIAYLVKRGKMNLYRKINGEETLEQSLQTGDMMGVVEIIQKSPRMFTAKADEYTSLIKIDPKVLKVIYKDSLPIVKTMLTQMANQIQNLESKIVPLKKKEKLADHFIGMNQTPSGENTEHFMKKVFRKGEFIFRKGEESNCAYRIKTGYVELIYEDEKEGEKTDILKAGDMFGELGVVSGDPRDFTARSGDHCELERIDRISLKNMIRDSHPIIKGVMEKVVDKLHSIEGKVAEFRMFDNIFMIFSTFLFRQATEGDDSINKPEQKLNIKGMSRRASKKINKTISLGEITKRVKSILIQLRAMHLIEIDEPSDPRYYNSTKITVKDVRLFLKKAQQSYDKYLAEQKKENK
ncbi:Cyclic nucleotide-binding domain protein [Candidatus Magnetomorum sp. HK-1]|nr:Cyclic nucleotide-binding domain protein [Candidatus Magnetomorum sp. HK-1]